MAIKQANKKIVFYPQQGCFPQNCCIMLIDVDRSYCNPLNKKKCLNVTHEIETRIKPKSGSWRNRQRLCFD